MRRQCRAPPAGTFHCAVSLLSARAARRLRQPVRALHSGERHGRHARLDRLPRHPTPPLRPAHRGAARRVDARRRSPTTRRLGAASPTPLPAHNVERRPTPRLSLCSTAGGSHQVAPRAQPGPLEARLLRGVRARRARGGRAAAARVARGVGTRTAGSKGSPTGDRRGDPSTPRCGQEARAASTAGELKPCILFRCPSSLSRKGQCISDLCALN